MMRLGLRGEEMMRFGATRRGDSRIWGSKERHMMGFGAMTRGDDGIWGRRMRLEALKGLHDSREEKNTRK